jgi:hypothetical protein
MTLCTSFFFSYFCEFVASLVSSDPVAQFYIPRVILERSTLSNQNIKRAGNHDCGLLVRLSFELSTLFHLLNMVLFVGYSPVCIHRNQICWNTKRLQGIGAIEKVA